MAEQMSVTFWTLFRSLLRGEKPDELEKVRAHEACLWFASELQVLRRFCSASEAELLGLIYSHWSKHKVSPSYTILKHNLQQESKPELEEHLKDYEAQKLDLPRLQVADLGAHLQTFIDEYSRDRLATTLKNALLINMSGAKMPVPGKKSETRYIKGPNDALAYVIDRMESGAFNSAPGIKTHGSLEKDAEYITERYDQRGDPEYTAHRRLFVGLNELDSKVKLRKGQFVGLLGFTGSGKTRLGRTMTYNAALNGASVLHFGFEQSYGEELERYGIIHSHHPEWGQKADGSSRGLSFSKLDSNELTPAELDFLRKEVIPDLTSGTGLFRGHLAIRQPTNGTSWEAVKTLIKIQDQQTPLDMVFIDYLTMISPSGSETWREAVDDAAQDAKNFAMTFRGNEGILLVTPLQANREGWLQAKKLGGLYEVNAIDTFSSLGKAMDTVMSVYSDAELEAESRIVLGLSKYRRGARIPPHKVGVIHECGLFYDMAAGAKLSSEVVEEVMEDL